MNSSTQFEEGPKLTLEQRLILDHMRREDKENRAWAPRKTVELWDKDITVNQYLQMRRLGQTGCLLSEGANLNIGYWTAYMRIGNHRKNELLKDYLERSDQEVIIISFKEFTRPPAYTWTPDIKGIDKILHNSNITFLL